jgi:DNA primase
LWWTCHRGSCNFKGKHTLNSFGAETHDEKRARVRDFIRTSLPVGQKQTLAERYHVEEETLDKAGWSYTPNFDGHGPRVIMPIYSPDGKRRGESFRSYTGATPKAIINGELAENMISWYKWKKYGKILAIFEDIPSAVRTAASGIDAVALCGTLLNIDRVIEIKEQGYNSVWLCLDEDAFGEAVKYIKLYQHRLKGLRVKKLTKDVKDMDEIEFELFNQEISLP